MAIISFASKFVDVKREVLKLFENVTDDLFLNTV